MTRALKSYAQTKDSGAEVLGDVPEHWEVKRLGQVGVFSKGNGGNKEDAMESGVPCVRYGDLYTSHNFFIETSRSCVSPEKANEYTPIQYGDVLFAGSGETIDEIGKSAVNLIQSGACCGGDVILFRSNCDVAARFMGYATDCAPAAIQKARMGRGITVMHIYAAELKNLILALPPLPEQSAIARFLDHMDRRIQRYIRAKEKLIALLDEYKQALIHQAVTGKIDVRTGQPYTEYRKNGFQWLGQVPTHWKTRRLKFLAGISSGQVDPRLVEHREKFLIAPNHIASGRGELESLETAEAQGADSGKYLVRKGDVVYSKIRPHLRKAAISPIDGLCSADMYPLQVFESEIRSQFFLYLLLSEGVTRYTIDCSLRVAMPKINREALGQCLFAYPELPEQSAILDWICQATNGIDNAARHSGREIDLVREYRTRLIADVVTGKLDVREAAAALPEIDPLASVETTYAT